MRAVRAVAIVLLLGPVGAARAQVPEPQVAGVAGQSVPAPAAAPVAVGQNTFLGSVPSGPATPGVLPLSLKEAVARGLKQNLGLLLGEQATRLADAGRWNALASLLPNLNADLRSSRQTINLEAYGFPLGPGQDPLVGPFNVVDARLRVSQTVFDWSAIQTARAGSASANAAKYSYEDAKELVVYVVANLYLQAVTGASRIESARAQLATAEAVYKRAVDMKAAGTVPGIEVLRAQVQMQAQQQRLIFYENEFAKEKLSVARAIGLPLGQQIDLTDPVPYAPVPPVPLEERLKQAYESRADVKSLEAQVKAAEASKQAAYGSYLPSVAITADYGDIGQTVSSAKTTYTVGAGLRIPIFEGGRARSRGLQADATLRQRQAELADLRARVEHELRSALLDVKAAEDRVQVAKGSVELAHQQLTQAQDRFAAGVASNLEVVQAQEAVAAADENYLSSLYSHNMAKIGLARALGQAQETLERFPGGTK